MNEKIESEIYKRIEALQESLQYSIAAMCEIQGESSAISYLIYTSKK